MNLNQKAHRHHSCVGFTELSHWRFLMLKIQGFCTYLLEKRSCFLQFSKAALTSPQQFYPGTFDHDTQAHRTFTSFSGSLKFPDFITRYSLWQPGHHTGSWEAPLLTTAWGQPAGWEITTSTLIYSNRICKQPCTCVCTEHAYLSWNVKGQIEEVFIATVTNFP